MADLTGFSAKPEYNSGFLFLLDIAAGFRNCYNCKIANNYQGLVRNLDALSLSLKGYYPGGAAQEARIKTAVFECRRILDLVIKEFELTNKLLIPESFCMKLYDLEAEMRDVWKTSGLQMKLKDMSEDDDF
jgi:hypothetical protein